MKRMLFVFCLFLSLVTAAMSAELYRCVDKDGNTFITDNPPQDVKCQSSEGMDDDEGQQQKSGEDQPTGSGNLDKAQKGEVKRLISIPRTSY
ncbi:MAG TPA: DUF4124 domain-containing protein [Smithella sp.]|nr:DUF4124 domain-containing protein [Smithella sp.]MDM7987907.1 DUF4124 domain-containing protein [Smithella sp.]HNY50592.1 DUF4124 domain-containing protein [Smithella sp.]HOG89159.1 DUF4124 domain-containing protein [Smithella sp.]HOU51701.1 DUF4124 domain-containing protein [Smithella sp.]